MKFARRETRDGLVSVLSYFLSGEALDGLLGVWAFVLCATTEIGHRPLPERPFAITFVGDGIDVIGRIVDEEGADRLIEAVKALKGLLQHRVKAPTGDSK